MTVTLETLIQLIQPAAVVSAAIWSVIKLATTNRLISAQLGSITQLQLQMTAQLDALEVRMRAAERHDDRQNGAVQARKES